MTANAQAREGGRDHARIPSLDGLRALSISFVLLAHGTFGLVGPGPIAQMAHFGVRVFFVISGYLITSLLLEEEKKTGTISLRTFYLRRTLRIFPPFYVFVGFVALGAALGWFELQRCDLLAALTYTTNYHHERSWNLGHAWSLSVEEQFYLLWPFLMKVLGSARASRGALAAVVICPLLRIGLLVLAPDFRAGIGETFPTVADQIATGCLLACYGGAIADSPRLLAFLRGRAFWCVPVIAVLAAHAPSAKLDSLIWQSVSNVGIALLIWRVVDNPERLGGPVPQRASRRVRGRAELLPVPVAAAVLQLALDAGLRAIPEQPRHRGHARPRVVLLDRTAGAALQGAARAPLARRAGRGHARESVAARASSVSAAQPSALGADGVASVAGAGRNRRKRFRTSLRIAARSSGGTIFSAMTMAP